MSTHEAPQFGDSFSDPGLKDLVLPGDIDQAWCDEFTAEHSGGDLSVVLETEVILASGDELAPYNRGPQRFYFYNLNTDEDGLAIVQGQLVDARMIPEYNRDERGKGVYIGHAGYLALTSAVQTYPPDGSYTYEWTRSPYDRVFVPLPEGGSLLLVPSVHLEQPVWDEDEEEAEEDEV